jgi:tetratricopeptide (TPR) repeat protein
MRRNLLVVGLMAALLTWPLVRVVEVWRFRVEVRRAERELNTGQFGRARAILARLSSRWPGRGEVEYPLGICEAAEGRVDDALDAWARIPANASEAVDGALRRGLLALDHGRFAIAEDSLKLAARAPDRRAQVARQALGKLLWFSGRSDEFRRLLREGWARSSDPSGTLRLLWQLDADAHPVAAIAESVERAAREAPDDDRVWLGRADLATRSGRFAEADGWLTRCEQRRPDDPAVTMARLDWAVAANRPDLAAPALLHIAEDRLTPARVVALRAWFAARRGDELAEREALTDLLELDSGDSAPLERLAELASRAGQSDLAVQFRRRKAELDRTREQYRKRMIESDLTAHAAELARLAEALGRRFDAKGWWTLLARRGGDDSEARAAITRLDRQEPTSTAPGRTLAGLIAEATRSASPVRVSAEQATLPAFVDTAEASGLQFHFDSGRSEIRQLPETMSGGVGLLDYDGDGWLDVFAIQGGPFPSVPGAPCGDRLFRNRGDGSFEDVSERSGIARMPGGYGHGVAVGDYDNDGRPDLFLTRWRSYALYHNKGDGTFEDTTVRLGLGGDRDWPTSAAWADLDGDGDLDLYVCHYLAWDTVNPRVCHRPDSRSSTYCDPRDFHAMPDHAFRNDGAGGKFVDVTAEAGFVDRDGRGLGVVAADLDGDGRTDVFVANDTTANMLFRNLGGFRFREEGIESGVAANANGGYLAGMGIACGDLDGDEVLDLAVTNFFGESTTFYHGLGGGQFSDHSVAVGLAAPSRFLLGFGIVFFDADNDGRLDVATANGHVNDYRPSVPFAMPAQLLIGTEGGHLVDISDRAGEPWKLPRLGRGLAVGDLDNDGRLDLVLVGQNEPLAVFHNRTAGGHFVSFKLDGAASNRDAVGARVTLTAGGRRRVMQRFGGGSYLSASDGRLHFGLGQSGMVDKVEVRWPSGRVDSFSDLKTDRGYLLREGNPEAKSLSGQPREVKK